ncbi:dihydrodipicolinate synthase family protein [Citricoccus sp. GCM10030269]|uniref:dihydrodipicolinate synthase family protein n=1 Tax=Citricoccus sp. GCM10030269 TaxID=3273388 RepID=UPI00360CAB87
MSSEHLFTGLSAFPLTPTSELQIDEPAVERLVRRLATAQVDSIGVLGSTGGYAYLSRGERRRVTRIAMEAAEGIPVIVGIGAMRTRDVLQLAEDAQSAGVAGVLLAPVSYQPLTDEEVFGLYEDVSAQLSVPLCVYDNPRTTGFTFTDELHARIAQLPSVASIKIPGVPDDPEAARARVDGLRQLIPGGVTIGISGDQTAANGLHAGCDAWYSVVGGLFPERALAISRTALSGDHDTAAARSAELDPLWELFRRYGSLRVITAAAEHLGLIDSPSLPRPLRGLPAEARDEVASIMADLELTS